MDKKKLKNYCILSSMYFLLIFVILAFFNFIILTGGDDIKNINFGYAYQKYINENNLSLPFPNYVGTGIHELDYNNLVKLYELNLTEFHKVLKDNYYYEQDSYNCRYWSFVWATYWAKNLQYEGYSFKFVNTNSHIFVMFFKSDEYCIADGKHLKCVDLI